MEPILGSEFGSTFSRCDILFILCDNVKRIVKMIQQLTDRMLEITSPGGQGLSNISFNQLKN